MAHKESDGEAEQWPAGSIPQTGERKNNIRKTLFVIMPTKIFFLNPD